MIVDSVASAWLPGLPPPVQPLRQDPPVGPRREVDGEAASVRRAVADETQQSRPERGRRPGETEGERHGPRVQVELDERGQLRALSVESADDDFPPSRQTPPASGEEVRIGERQVMEMAGRARVAAAPRDARPADDGIVPANDRSTSAHRLGQVIQDMIGSDALSVRRFAAVA